MKYIFVPNRWLPASSTKFTLLLSPWWHLTLTPNCGHSLLSLVACFPHYLFFCLLRLSFVWSYSLFLSAQVSLISKLPPVMSLPVTWSFLFDMLNKEAGSLQIVLQIIRNGKTKFLRKISSGRYPQSEVSGANQTRHTSGPHGPTWTNGCDRGG